MTAVESSGKSAMHAEMVRRGGAGAWITAYRQLVALDHHLCTGAYVRQHISEVTGSFRFRDVDDMVGHGAIIPLFLMARGAKPYYIKFFAAILLHEASPTVTCHTIPKPDAEGSALFAPAHGNLGRQEPPERISSLALTVADSPQHRLRIDGRIDPGIMPHPTA